MDVLLEEILENWYKLFEVFGWWSLLMVLCVFLIMLPINFLFIKLFAIGGENEYKERLRKFTSSLSVFVVSGAALTLFSILLSDIINTSNALSVDFILHNAIPLAVLAMLIRSLYKMVRDLGFKPIAESIIYSRTLKKEIGKYVGDPKVVDLIFDFLSSNKKYTKNAQVEDAAKSKTDLISELENKLKGIIEKPDEISKNILDYIFNKQKEVV